MTKWRNIKIAVKIILSLILAAVVFWGALYGIRQARQKFLENGLETTERNLRRGAAACYALEGRYPDSLAYLTQYYGVTVDESRYIVYYSVFASNLMPDITVALR